MTNDLLVACVHSDADRGALDSLHRLPGDDERPPLGGKLRRSRSSTRCLFGASGRIAPTSTLSSVSLRSPRLSLSLTSPERRTAMTAFWAMSFFWLRLAHADPLLGRRPVSKDGGLHRSDLFASRGFSWQVIR